MNYRKNLEEQRQNALDQMTALRATVETENRAFTEDEDKAFAKLRAEVERIDATVKAIDESRTLVRASEPATEPEAKKTESVEEIETRAFANIIRVRADENITKGDHGAIIPKTIINKIVDKIYDISPLFGQAQKYNIKGTVSIPYVDSANDNIHVAFADEFVDLEAKATKLLTVDLSSYLAGVEAKISKSLLNSTDLDLVNFVIGKMAKDVAKFLDSAILVGNDKITGLKNAEQTVTITAAVDADKLIEMQGTLKSAFQGGAMWVMAPATLTAIRKLKDNDGRYLFNYEVKDGFTGTILGKPVYTSDQAPALGEDGAIVYLDPSEALAAKIVEDSVQVLQERYATQHALGIVAYIETDVKIQNQQAVVRSTKA